MPKIALIYLTTAFSLNALANILLKLGAARGFNYTNYFLFLGIASFAANMFFYFLALKTVPLSTAYPIMVIMSFLIINAFAYVVLKESITSLQMVGYGLIVIGLILIFYFGDVQPNS